MSAVYFLKTLTIDAKLKWGIVTVYNDSDPQQVIDLPADEVEELAFMLMEVIGKRWPDSSPIIWERDEAREKCEALREELATVCHHLYDFHCCNCQSFTDSRDA